MKNLSIRQTVILSYGLAFFPLAIIFVQFGWQPINKSIEYLLYLMFLVFIVSMGLAFYFILKLQNIKKQDIFITTGVYGVIIGLISLYQMNDGEVSTIRLICIGAAMVAMYDGNRSPLIPQDSPEAGLMQAYDKVVYQKTQRMWGRTRFGFGLAGLFLAIFTPTTYGFAVVIIFGIIYYIAVWIYLYKASKAAW